MRRASGHRKVCAFSAPQRLTTPMDNPTPPARKPAAILGVVFLTVLLDLVGFGIVIPLLPLMAKEFGAPGWMAGAIMGVVFNYAASSVLTWRDT